MTERGVPSAEFLGLRPQVYAFAQLMEKKLQLNDQAKEHWKKQGLSSIYAHFKLEVKELRDELFDRARPEETALEAADVACLAMMIADIIFGLEVDRDFIARAGSEGSGAGEIPEGFKAQL